MVSRKAQSKAGIAERRRGQQMGDERSQPSKVAEAQRETPAQRGRRKEASKFFADKSSQVVGGGGEAPSAASPSVPAAIPKDVKVGESGGERAFKSRQKAARKPVGSKRR
jgi:hypothetical protein